jgi:hypothetical protein
MPRKRTRAGREGIAWVSEKAAVRSGSRVWFPLTQKKEEVADSFSHGLGASVGCTSPFLLGSIPYCAREEMVCARGGRRGQPRHATCRVVRLKTLLRDGVETHLFTEETILSRAAADYLVALLGRRGGLGCGGCGQSRGRLHHGAGRGISVDDVHLERVRKKLNDGFRLLSNLARLAHYFWR